MAALITQIQQQQQNTGGGNIGTGNEGTLVPGPGLGGGGVLIGNVPIRLTAPIPWGLDDGGGGGDGDPGPPGMAGIAGVNGATGGVGPTGPAIFMAADDGQDGDIGAPGLTGPTGAIGPVGPIGPAGTTLVYVNTTIPAGNTVANTSSETFFTSSYTVPANSLAIGTVLRLKLFGIYSTGVVAPSLSLRVYFGATVLIASGTLTTVAGVTNDGWSAEGLFTVQGIGSSGTMEAQGLSEFSTASTAVLFVNMDNTAPVTVDTTINETVRASVQWGGTVNASDTITLREMTVEVLSVAGIPVTPSVSPAVMFFMDDGVEGDVGPPGPPGAGVALTALGARVSLQGTQTIANNTTTTISWDTLRFDTGGFFNAGSPTIFTVPSTGLYWVGVSTNWALASSGERFVAFRVNASTDLISFACSPLNDISANAGVSTSVLLSLSAGDTVKVVVFQGSGANLNLSPTVLATTDQTNTFSIAKIH